jgi:hypothetical protein
VLLASLWAFAPDITDVEEEATGEVDLLASGLTAVDDGTRLSRSGVHGADLLVSAVLPDQPDTSPLAAALTGEGSLR